jgi:hypothetical protein
MLKGMTTLPLFYTTHIYISSADDVLPSQLPKQYFIKNGLRSNYYKTTAEANSKSIMFVFYFSSMRLKNISFYF